MSTLSVGICQVRAFDLDKAEDALATCLGMVDEAVAQGAELIVLPECAYPAYILHSRDEYERYARPRAELLELFSQRARSHGVSIAAGLAIPNEDDVLVNAVLFFNREGELAEQYVKTFLWHFDRRWFAVGGRYPVVEVGGARAGMLICADGRQPEIARSLAVGGAQIILDSTAWVSFGRTPEQLRTGQVAYFMPTRAIENGCWVIAADKAGTEADTIVYAGRSGVIAPDGAWFVQASGDQQELLLVDIPVTAPGPPVARRPALYRDLLRGTADTEASAARTESLRPAEAVGRVAVLQAEGGLDEDAYCDLIAHHLRVQGLQDAGVLVAPDLLEGELSAPGLARLRTLVDESDVPALFFAAKEPENGGSARVGYLLQRGEAPLRHVATHGGRWEEPGPLGEQLPPVVDTPAGRVGLLVGAEGLVPELSRSLMVRGVDVVLWASDFVPYRHDLVVRARGDENRVYVAAALPRGFDSAGQAVGGAYIADPSGAIAAEGLADRDLSFSAQISWAATRLKEMAPGTDALQNRLPETYAPLAGW